VLRNAVRDADAARPALLAEYDADPPDLALCEPVGFAGRLVAARHRAPVVLLRVTIVTASWTALTRADAEADGSAARFRARLGELAAAYGSATTISSATTTSGSATSATRSGNLADTGPQLAFLPRSFQPDGAILDGRYDFVGPCRRPPTGADAPWRPPGDGRPIVLVTLGTIDNQRPEFFRTAVEALAELDVHAVLAVGESVRPADLGRPPRNVEVHQLVPQLDVLDHAALLVSHAGLGGVMEALSAGVPLLLFPQTREQEANADRAVELGLGRRLATPVTAPGIRAAVTEVLGDRGIAERVAAMRAEIQAAGGARRAADLVEANLR
jgi:MGT family glycosyltransferase